MDKTYSPKAIEQKWYQFWENSGFFKPNGTGSPYCIMIPPPNVTGSLHMGHALNNSIMDTLIRYHRMQGHNTLWQVGVDHAGIATQMVVERQLAAQNISRQSIGREEFVKKIWDWKEQSGNTICNQLRRLGSSVDWETERFTMDDGFTKAVQKAFVELYKEGIIYRGKRLVNWDPVLLTAVSDLEVVAEEEPGFLWHIKYPIVNSKEFLIIATTRPETMLGDTAVAVHPEDHRYKHLIGKKLKLPLTNREIPIIADDYVDPEFGSGCVKITPAHDFNDHEIGKRHNLPILNIFTADAKINVTAPLCYQGMDRFAAREKIIKDLEELSLLEKTETHTLKIPRGDRTKTIIEPYLTDQWFVKTETLAAPAIQVVKSGQIKFVPENWSKTYFEWMNNIQDWCISRQIWWGHRIPAWYDANGNVYVGEDIDSVRTQYNLPNELSLQQDTDVLDTWFSSALWPFATLGWPEQTSNLEKFYPTSVLVTGFDIIFFWVARIIMFGLKFTGKIPFHTVYIHALIQDQDGQKMSKSKGNVLDPIDLIDGISLEDLIIKRTSGLMQPQMARTIENYTRKQFPKGIQAYGTDALRFTFCALATTGRHVRFDMARIESYRNFCNKLWNASRYVLMNTEGHSSSFANDAKTLSLADQWIKSIWQKTKIAIVDHMAKYRLDLVAQDIYEFTWNQYCDWYLEFSKPILTGSNTSEAQLCGTRHTLLYILEELLRVIHPIMPFITEEIWQRTAPLTNNECKALIANTFPTIEHSLINPETEDMIEWIKLFITGIRNIRGEMNISPNKALPVFLLNANSAEQARINHHALFLNSLAKVESISWLENEDQQPPSATALIGYIKLLIPIKDIIDKSAETARLKKEIEKVQKELDRTQTKLANPDYANKAPVEVVNKERSRLSELQIAMDKLIESLRMIEKI